MKNNPRRFRARALATLTIAALGVTTLFSGASAEEVEPNPDGASITSTQTVEPRFEITSRVEPSELLELDSTGALSPISVFRFWSPTFGGHFYTTDPAERDHIIRNWSRDWKQEGTAFKAFATEAPGTVPVYRFWSPVYKSHFYTASASEKNEVQRRWPTIWQYEKVAFFAYPESSTAPNTTSVYRFWGPSSKSHFYTVSASERDIVRQKWPTVWSYEGPRFKLPNFSSWDPNAASTEQASRGLNKINQVRAEAGLPPLQLNDQLTQAVKSQASYQATNKTMTDEGFEARITESGYIAVWVTWIVAEGYVSVDDLITDVLTEDPGIHDGLMTDFALATAVSADGTIYWAYVIAEAQ